MVDRLVDLTKTVRNYNPAQYSDLSEILASKKVSRRKIHRAIRPFGRNTRPDVRRNTHPSLRHRSYARLYPPRKELTAPRSEPLSLDSSMAQIAKSYRVLPTSTVSSSGSSNSSASATGAGSSGRGADSCRSIFSVLRVCS